MLAAMARSDPDPRALQPGDAFGEYVIDDQLGEGGMGIVFRAIREDGAVVALKVIKPGLVADEKTARRFAREARAAGEVEHPHLIDVLDAGDIDGIGYMAMRYVGGQVDSTTASRRAGRSRSRTDADRRRDRLRARRAARRRARAPRRQALEHHARRRARRAADRLRARQAARLRHAHAPGQMLGTLDYIAPEMLRGDEPGRAPTSTRSAA